MADDARFEVRATAQAAANPVIMLWPDGVPGGRADIGPEIEFRNEAAGGAAMTTMIRNVSDPSLTVFTPEPSKANGVGVVICPGGGWRLLAWEHEGLDMACWLAGRGYTAFVLKYRLNGTPSDPAEYAAAMAKMGAGFPTVVPYPKAPLSLDELVPNLVRPRKVAADDGRRALAIVRERAAEWGLDPKRIGMAGFSAGAYLTTDVALEPDGAPLAFAAPIYGGEMGGRAVPADAPPLFMAIAQDDRLLLRSVEGVYAAWMAADRPTEFHLFARGGHGFGMVRRGLPTDRWIDLFGDWLADRGIV